MHETEVRAALLLAAIEADRAGDGRSALPDRATLDAAARAATTSPAGSPEWIRSRTRLAWERLLPAGDPASAAARAWLARVAPVGRPILIAAALAFVVGAAVDRLAGAPYLRLVEPAIWALIAFNLGAYLALAISAFVRAPRADAATALVRRVRARLAAGLMSTPPAALAGVVTPAAWARFASEWRAAVAALDAARIRATLHASAAMLALGVIAGLYARGLTTDYAVGWESTFLDADAMRTLVHTLLGPAAALSGLPLPDRDTIAALRVVPGGAVTGAGAAAPLIHLNALSLVLAVVLPRLVLAALSWRRALALRQELPTPESLRLVSPATTPVPPAGDFGRMVVLAYGAVDPGRGAALAAALSSAGSTQVLDVATGDEDAVVLPTAADTLLLLVPMTSIPEAESHGRLLARLRLALPTARIVVALDTEAFERRFGQWPARVGERRAAWRAFATEAGVAIALVDLASADGSQWRTAITRALAPAPGTEPAPR